MPKDLEVCILVSVCVHCLLAQTFPYVSFNGQTLANHSYVNLSLVGNGNDSVVCHTDLDKCCSAAQGPHRGDWYFPGGTRLRFDGGITENRDAQRVNILHHKTNEVASGIYRCYIPTNAVHDDMDRTVRDAVYVGLYLIGGEQSYSNTKNVLLSFTR